jgi:hypothetical protein
MYVNKVHTTLMGDGLRKSLIGNPEMEVGELMNLNELVEGY